MGTTQRKRESITQEQIENVKRMIKNLPSKQIPVVSTREAVQSMRKEIMSLKSRGYDFSEIAEQLANAGISISAATLKSYLRTPSKKKKENEVQDPLKETA
jgi:intracellular sulfur oxidation DsrE/DsrF family protein